MFLLSTGFFFNFKNVENSRRKNSFLFTPPTKGTFGNIRISGNKYWGYQSFANTCSLTAESFWARSASKTDNSPQSQQITIQCVMFDISQPCRPPRSVTFIVCFALLYLQVYVIIPNQSGRIGWNSYAALFLTTPSVPDVDFSTNISQ
jgi:hypothetical protein